SGRTAWLWVAVTASFTVFRVACSRGRVVVRDLLGAVYGRVLTTDRWSAYNGTERRQLCWAHLRRDFQALIDRGGAAKGIGEPLLSLSDLVFHNWKRIRDADAGRGRAPHPRLVRPGRAVDPGPGHPERVGGARVVPGPVGPVRQPVDLLPCGGG